MGSTCGEIEIFPILLIRLPSSSFYFKLRVKAKEKENRKEKIPLIDRFFALSHTHSFDLKCTSNRD